MHELQRKLLLCLALSAAPSCALAGYDPLELPKQTQVEICDLTAHDAARKRDIPLRCYLPQGRDAAPVVLFSHGLGGSRRGSAYLGNHWAARGYVVVAVQHPGSDESVWKDLPPLRRMAALQAAASLKNSLLRFQDIPAVLDQLERWNKQPGHKLAGRLDLAHVGMSGHSFGAVTTQGVSGQRLPIVGQRYTDTRIDAAIAFSPSSPRRGDPAAAFGAVKIPWMLMTGTHDNSPIGQQTPQSRRKVYPYLPDTIDKYEVVLDHAEHSAFGDRPLPGDRLRRNPNHHRAILALSTAFWDTHLRGLATARAWLHGQGPRSVLESKDLWQYHAAEQQR